MAKSRFEPHPIAWTREKAQRVWNYQSTNAALSKNYFSRQVGDTVIDFVARHVALNGQRVLDFGCGPGYLVEKLVKRKIDAAGIDFSSASIGELKRRCEGNRYFRDGYVVDSLPTPLPDGSQNVVFFCDIIEHLLPDESDATLREVARLIPAGGHVVVTTNNEEELEADHQLCPECGCIFHRVQHVTSWTVEGLSSFMSGYGFSKRTCEATIFRPQSLLNPLIDLASRFVLKTKPYNLIYIGTKR